MMMIDSITRILVTYLVLCSEMAKTKDNFCDIVRRKRSCDGICNQLLVCRQEGELMKYGEQWVVLLEVRDEQAIRQQPRWRYDGL